MTTYTFNEHGVCTNPDTVLKKVDKEYSAILSVCQLPSGQWTYGYMISVNFGDQSGCAGPASKSGPKYANKEAAAKAATEFYLRRIQEMLKSAREWNLRQRPSVPDAQLQQTTLF